MHAVHAGRYRPVSSDLWNRVVRALILAAGRGSRMGLHCSDRPKCLLKLDGRPLIERQIEALQRGGIDEIGVVRGYRADMIDFPDLYYFENKRWAETNMVMSLTTAREWLRCEPTIISYGDIFYRQELVRNLARAKGDCVVAYDRAWQHLWYRRFADPLADAETFRISRSGRLIAIGGKTGSISEIEGQYMGLLKITPTAWHIIEDSLVELDPSRRDLLSMTELLSMLLNREFPVCTISTKGQWGEVDSPRDLALYETMIRDGDLLLE
jgi:L-glutamine-phosphate cytidylyltransferase